jgi:glycosyltransferase involved in cell wall biosynthesis
MNEREVSVIIPVYGLQLGIINTIESLLKQTFQPKEIIIVSDQENEDGMKFMENYIKSYVSKKSSHQRVNVRVISRLGRRGLSSARNLGAHVASGNIIAYIDSDAVASPCWLENLLKGYNTSENIGGVGGPIKPTKNITRFQELVFKALKQPGVIYEDGKLISIAGGNTSYLKELCLRIEWLWLYNKNYEKYPDFIKPIVKTWLPSLNAKRLLKYLISLPFLILLVIVSSHVKKFEKFVIKSLQDISIIMHSIGYLRGLKRVRLQKYI